MHRAFLRGLGSPNYCNHDASCARNVQHAALSVMGSGRKSVSYDLKNSRHVVLQLRNIFESINVQEVNDLLDAMEKGCKLTVIDIRANIPATKAHNFFMVRPRSDYAFNLAVIHELLASKRYNAEFARMHIQDLEALAAFVEPYSPEWAETETGVPAGSLRRFVGELVAASPAVLWHPGWMTARYRNSFYVCRSIYIINALLGSIGAAEWEIWSGLARRLGLDALAFDSIEDIWNFQLNGTGVTIADFEATGKVALTDQPQYRDMAALKFKTPSGKIEIVSDDVIEPPGRSQILSGGSPAACKEHSVTIPPERPGALRCFPRRCG